MRGVTLQYEEAVPSFSDALSNLLLWGVLELRVTATHIEPLDLVAIQLLAGAGYDITVGTP